MYDAKAQIQCRRSGCALSDRQTHIHTQRQINRQKDGHTDGRTDTPLVSGLCELSCGSGSTLCRIQSEREARREVERDG